MILMPGAALKEEPDWTGFTGLIDEFILSILLILSESLLSGAPAKNKPQMNAPSRASGGRTHVLLRNMWILHSGGHDADERRFVVPGLYRRRKGSLAA